MVRFILGQYLAKKGLSSAQLERTVKGIAPITARKYAAGERNPTLESLDKVITALRQLTGEEVTVADLLEYVPNKR